MYEVCMSAGNRIEPSFNNEQANVNGHVQEQYIQNQYIPEQPIQAPPSINTLMFEDEKSSGAGGLLIKSGGVALLLITLYTGSLIWKNMTHDTTVSSLENEQVFTPGHNPPKKIRNIDLRQTASVKTKAPKTKDFLTVKSLLKKPISPPVKKVVTQSIRQQQPGAKFHVVESGDTISRIGRLYKISAAKIMEINAIEDPRSIKPGMKVIVSQ